MLYPKIKEREHRFKLALRMGLPIFVLTMTLVFSLFNHNFKEIPYSFYISSTLFLAVMVYFFFYMIYRSFDERLTDSKSGLFTRDYITNYLSQKIKKGEYTIILISIENLKDINELYGLKNGDIVVSQSAEKIGAFFNDKGIKDIPIGYFKGGDFLIGLEGRKERYEELLALLEIKEFDYKVNDIEIHFSSSIIDNSMSFNIDDLIDYLYDIQIQNREFKNSDNPKILSKKSEAEIEFAIKERMISVQYQPIFNEDRVEILEISVKLLCSDGAIFHQNEYLPVIKRLGLQSLFDLIVLEKIAEDACLIKGNVKIASIFSPTSIRNANFYKKLDYFFGKYPNSRNKIIFILSEKEIFRNVKWYNVHLQRYRKEGVEIALDRFGYYNSTLEYLKSVEVDIVRFDASITKDIEKREIQAVLNGLIAISDELNIKNWIRMITNEQKANIIKANNITFKQGNFFSKIAPLNEIKEQL